MMNLGHPLGVSSNSGILVEKESKAIYLSDTQLPSTSAT